MNIVKLINDSPMWLGVIYLLVEVGKGAWRYKISSAKNQNDLSTVMLDMVRVNQEGLKEEKKEITELTDLLKKANFEISLLERKVGTLMNVIDRCIAESPNSKKLFTESMNQFNEEMESMRRVKNV